MVSYVNDAITSERSLSKENRLTFSTFIHCSIGEFVCVTNNHLSIEMLIHGQTDRHTHTHTNRPSTVTLAAHVCRALISVSKICYNLMNCVVSNMHNCPSRISNFTGLVKSGTLRCNIHFTSHAAQFIISVTIVPPICVLCMLTSTTSE